MPLFFVINHTSGSGASKWTPINTFDAPTADDACGLAAIQSKLNGKFTAFPLASATTKVVEIQPTANLTPATFDG